MAHRRHHQSLDKGSGEGEGRGGISGVHSWAGYWVIGGEGKAGHVCNGTKATYVTSHNLRHITEITET